MSKVTFSTDNEGGDRNKFSKTFGTTSSKPVFSFVEEGKRVALGEKQETHYWDTVTINGKQFLVERGDLEAEAAEIKLDQARKALTSSVVGKAQCSLCCHRFAADSLSGVISMKRVMDLRKEWGMEQQGKRFAAASYAYSKARLCLFCSQFFTSKDGDHIVRPMERQQEPLEEIIAEELHNKQGTTKKKFEVEHELNLAAGPTASVSQSSIANGQGPSVAVDGQLGGCLVDRCCQTRVEHEPWFEVVLSTVEPISTVRVFNRRDEGSSLTYRLCPFWFMLAFVNIADRPLHEAKKMAHEKIRVTKHEDLISWDLFPPVRAAVIRVQAEGLKSLQLAQVVILKAVESVAPRKLTHQKTARMLRSPGSRPGSPFLSLEPTIRPLSGTRQALKNPAFDGQTGTFFLTGLVDIADSKSVAPIANTVKPPNTAPIPKSNKLAKTVKIRPRTNGATVDSLFASTAKVYNEMNEFHAKLQKNTNHFSSEEVAALEQLFIQISKAEKKMAETAAIASSVPEPANDTGFVAELKNRMLSMSGSSSHNAQRMRSSFTPAVPSKLRAAEKIKLNLDEPLGGGDLLDRSLLLETKISGTQLNPVFRQLSVSFHTKKKKKAEHINILFSSEPFKEIFCSDVLDRLEEKLMGFASQYDLKEGLPSLKWPDFLLFLRILLEHKWRLLPKVFHMAPIKKGAHEKGSSGLVTSRRERQMQLWESSSSKLLPDMPSISTLDKRFISTAPLALETGDRTRFPPASPGSRPFTTESGFSQTREVQDFLATMNRKGTCAGPAQTLSQKNLQRLASKVIADSMEPEVDLNPTDAYRKMLQSRRQRQQVLLAETPEPDVEPRKFQKTCGLCHLSFAGGSFPTSVSLKVLSSIVQKFNSESHSTVPEAKLNGSLSQYHRIPLCTFCTQFIDPDQPDGLAKTSCDKQITGYIPFYDDRYPHAVGLVFQRSHSGHSDSGGEQGAHEDLSSSLRSKKLMKMKSQKRTQEVTQMLQPHLQS